MNDVRVCIRLAFACASLMEFRQYMDYTFAVNDKCNFYVAYIFRYD